MTDSMDYEAYEITSDELNALPRQRQIAPGLKEYNFSSERAASDFIRNASEKQRIEIYAHDGVSDLMVQFFSNPGHSTGMSAGHLESEIHRYGSLSNMLEGNSPIGELGNIDFFQLRVHEK